MKGADKVICQAAAVLLLFAITSVPASAQMGFGGGGGDIMSVIGPMMRMANFGGGHRRHRRHY